jgi:hypothetical protein
MDKRMRLMAPALIGLAVLSALVYVRVSKRPTAADRQNSTAGPRDNPSPGATPETRSPATPTSSAGTAPVVPLPRDFSVEGWIRSLRALDRAAAAPEALFGEVQVLIAQLAQWLREKPERLEEVATLVRTEQNADLWGPALFAIARCRLPAGRAVLKELLTSGADSEKAAYAVIAGLEGGESRGEVSLPGFIRASVSDRKDPDFTRAAATELMRSTDQPLRMSLAQAVKFSVRDDEVVRAALLSIFSSAEEDDDLRTVAALSLATAIKSDLAVSEAAQRVLRERLGGDDVLKETVDLLSVSPTTETGLMLGEVVKGTAYSEDVREHAASRLAQSGQGADAQVARSLLVAYPAQPKSVRLAILHALAKSRDPGVADQLSRLTADEDDALKKEREAVILTIRGSR